MIRRLLENITDAWWFARLRLRRQVTASTGYRDHPAADADGWIDVDPPEPVFGPTLLRHDATGRIVAIECGPVDERQRGVFCGVTDQQLDSPCDECAGDVYEETWLWETVDRVLDGLTAGCEDCGVVWWAKAPES